MSEVNRIEIQLQKFQQTGLNSGGIWRAIEILKNGNTLRDSLVCKIRETELYDNKENYIKYFKQEYNFENYRTENLELMKLNNWEVFFAERIQHWSQFELISKEENRVNFSEEEFCKQNLKFKELLKFYLDKYKLENVYKINETKFDTVKTEWGDQISEDVIFELESRILLIHFGWSS